MSTVHIHVGQCGNQISIPLWKNFVSSKHESSKQLFTSLDGYHRSVHIDSEVKVVQSLPGIFKVRESNIVVGKRGRGTNFALGYHGMMSTGDDHVLEQSMEAVRREVERCDVFSGAVVYHSISGGTGSGLGAHVIELLRDHFPCSHIISCAVAPCVSGESPLQSYNALLALHWLQTYTDSVFLLKNDFYISYLNHLLKTEDGCQVSFKDINRVIANSLSGVFLPTSSLSTSRGVSIGQEPWELVRTVAPIPSTKFINLSHHTSAKLSWEGLISKVLRNHPKFDSEANPTRTLSATVVARGDRDNTFMSAVRSSLEKKIRKCVNFVDWNPYPLDCWTDNLSSGGTKDSCSLTMATNSSCILDDLKTVLSQSLVKLNSGAYVHWYHRYGISQEIFLESIETMQTVISDYETATKS